MQNIRGFFQWKNGKIEKLKGYYIYDEVGKSIKIEQKRIDSNKNSSQPAKPSKALTVLTTILCIATIILGVSTISLKGLYNKQAKLQESMQESIAEQEATIKKQSDTIAELQEQLLNNVIDESGKSTAEYLLERLENNEITLNNQADVIAELKSLIEKNQTEDQEIKYIMYSVQSGDTLLNICKNKNVDYYANKNIILSMNGINDPNAIYAGQNIVLPVIS